MRVSMSLPDNDWAACGPAARQAEEDGFDSVSSHELKHDPFAPLAFAALATERVQLVTSVAIAFPRSPMIVANQVWDLHKHSKGRFVIGLGSQVKAPSTSSTRSCLNSSNTPSVTRLSSSAAMPGWPAWCCWM